MVKDHQFNPHACGSSGGVNDEFLYTCIDFSSALIQHAKFCQSLLCSSWFQIFTAIGHG